MWWVVEMTLGVSGGIVWERATEKGENHWSEGGLPRRPHL